MPIGAGVELSDMELYRGTIIISEAADALVGMEFLRTAQKALSVDRHAVVLMNEIDGGELRRSLAPGE
jgi:hypothetical protein